MKLTEEKKKKGQTFPQKVTYLDKSLLIFWSSYFLSTSSFSSLTELAGSFPTMIDYTVRHRNVKFGLY